MAFDFKKEFKEFYMPKNKSEIVNEPKANYIAVRGKQSKWRRRGIPTSNQCSICCCIHIKNELQDRL